MLDDERSRGSSSVTSDAPAMLDSETACLMRSYMVPAIDAAQDWTDLNETLGRKGLEIGFRDGRLVFKRLDTGEEVCTGRFLGTPLRDLVRKLGRPCIKAHADGHTGSLLV